MECKPQHLPGYATAVELIYRVVLDTLDTTVQRRGKGQPDSQGTGGTER